MLDVPRREQAVTPSRLSPIILAKIESRKRVSATAASADDSRQLEFSDWYSALPGAIRTAIGAQARLREYRSARIVRSLGDGHTLDFVVRGAVRVDVGEGKTARTVCYLAPGTWFADPGILLDSRRLFSLVAHGASVLRSVSASDLSTVRQDPCLVQAIARLSFTQAVQAATLLQETSSSTLRTRLAASLRRLSSDFGVRVDPHHLQIALEIRQGDLGKMVGACRQRINAELKTFEREGILSLNRYITVTDLPALERVAA